MQRAQLSASKQNLRCAAPSLPMLQVQSLQGALKREQTEVLRLREQLQLMTAGGWGGATPS